VESRGEGVFLSWPPLALLYPIAEGGGVMKRLPICLLGASLLLMAVLASQRPLQAVEVVSIKIYHVQNKIVESGEGLCCGTEKRDLDASATFHARKDSTVRISIVDANPLLFKYTLQLGTAVQTANSKALGGFADSLDSFLANFAGPATATGASPLARFVSAPPTGDRCQQAINGLVTLAGKINKAAAERGDIASQSLTDHAAAKNAVKTWDLSSRNKELKQLDQDLEAIAVEFLKSHVSGSGVTAPCSDPDAEGVVALARTELPSIGKVLDNLNEFAKLVDQIDEPIALPPFVVNIDQDQPIILKIAKSDNWPPGLSDKKLFIGDASFTVSPLSRVSITFGAAAVYSFVRAPTFSAASSGGQFVVKQTKNDYKKVDGAVMMQVEPTAWDLGPLNVGFQVGVAPKTDLGLFLGLSLRAANHFTLGAGVAFQRVDRLGPGLAVGQTIASQDALKTEKTFRSGLYLNITVTTTKKK
jgi:hypothetical protein